MARTGTTAGGSRAAAAATPAALAQWALIAAAVAELPPQRLAEPSRLPGWTVADLVAHCRCCVGALLAALRSGEEPRVGIGIGVDAAGYLLGVGARAEQIADTARTDAAAGRGGAELRTDVDALALELPAADPTRPVPTPGGGMALGEFVLTRVVEGVVHGLDLGIQPDRGALRAVVKLFTGMIAAAAPGKSVELRIPPFAAVQIVAGLRHTRGTPPNVVEVDPVAFVELAAGRLAWADAAADGRLRASGSRADLTAYLPLL